MAEKVQKEKESDKHKKEFILDKALLKKDKKNKYFLKKQNLVYIFLILIDIFIIIYCARKNVVNYVEVLGHEVFVGDTKNLLFGRNYITLVVSLFFYVYTLSLQKIFFRKKLSKKYLITLFLFYLVLNIFLFYIFTKRVY